MRRGPLPPPPVTVDDYARAVLRFLVAAPGYRHLAPWPVEQAQAIGVLEARGEIERRPLPVGAPARRRSGAAPEPARMWRATDAGRRAAASVG